MGQINSLPSVVMPAPKPPGMQPKKDPTKQKKQQDTHHHDADQDQPQDDSDGQSEHVDVKA
jgi:hypothetical protein